MRRTDDERKLLTEAAICRLLCRTPSPTCHTVARVCYGCGTARVLLQSFWLWRRCEARFPRSTPRSYCNLRMVSQSQDCSSNGFARKPQLHLGGLLTHLLLGELRDVAVVARLVRFQLRPLPLALCRQRRQLCGLGLEIGRLLDPPFLRQPPVVVLFCKTPVHIPSDSEALCMSRTRVCCMACAQGVRLRAFLFAC